MVQFAMSPPSKNVVAVKIHKVCIIQMELQAVATPVFVVSTTNAEVKKALVQGTT